MTLSFSSQFKWMTFRIGRRKTSDRPENVRKEGTRCWFLSHAMGDADNHVGRQVCVCVSQMWVYARGRCYQFSFSISIYCIGSITHNKDSATYGWERQKHTRFCSLFSSRRANLWGLHNTHRLTGKQLERQTDTLGERQRVCLSTHLTREFIWCSCNDRCILKPILHFCSIILWNILTF